MTDPNVTAFVAEETAAGPGAGGPASERRSRSIWAEALHTLSRRPTVILATLVALFFLFMVIFPRAFTSTDPQRCDISQSKIKPQWFGHPHPFGTDVHGCDVYSQLVHGARPSLVLALLVVAVSVVLGLVLGLLAGYYVRWVDAIISRVIEVFLVIPLLLAALLVLSLFRGIDTGEGTFGSIVQPAIVLTAFAWMGYARYVRASVLETKNLDYVTAARVLGASDLRIMVRHILPNAVGTVTALVPTAIAGIISTEAVLAFLGVGVQPPAISWGIMISNGAPWFLGGAKFLLLFPLACLVATVLSFVVIGDNLRDALDPKLR